MIKKTKLTLSGIILELPTETIQTIEEIKNLQETDNIKEVLEILLAMGNLLYNQIKSEYKKHKEG